MLRRWTAALMLASAVAGVPLEAACAHAQAADSFESLPRQESGRSPHYGAWACGIAGVGLVLASFPLAEAADRRYQEYLTETDPARIEERYQATQHADYLASGALLTGEALVVSAIYLRFVRRPSPPRASVAVLPGRCAVSVRF
jgi:hypothetical protein